LKDYVIKPDGWTMNGSDRCHGISQERAMKEGVDINIVLKEYKNDIEHKCLKFVCHNINFDVKVVLNECVMAGIDINKVETFCSMVETINLCEVTPKVRGQYKWPKLSELYLKFFKSEMENAHNS
jgi:DNA polymerase III epsilon subunit-like protein